MIYLFPLVRSLLTLLSLLLEASLSALASILSKPSALPSQRGWSDTPPKGNAIVISSQNNHQISSSIALSLASPCPPSSSSSSFNLSAAASKLSPRHQPYTCIVLLSDPNHLPTLVAEWAEAKARIERQELERRKSLQRTPSTWFLSHHHRRRRQTYPDPDPITSPSSPSTSPIAPEDHLHHHHHHQPDSTVAEEEADQAKEKFFGGRGSSPSSMISSGSVAASPSIKKKRSRTVSWGTWSAPDLVGYGRDMLKGWTVGQINSPGIGSVIPIVADLQTQEGLSHARSTISAYCASHNLLLKGLIIIPSILGRRPDRHRASSPDHHGAEAHCSLDEPVPINALGLEDGAGKEDRRGRSSPSSPFLSATGNVTAGLVGLGGTGSPSANLAHHASSTSLASFQRRNPSESVSSRDRDSTAWGPSSSLGMLTGLSPPLSPRSNRIRERREEHLSLLSETMKADVLDPLGLASSLYEDLTRDKGRVLTFVPSGRASGSAKVDELRAKRSKRDRRSFATGQAVGSPRRSSRRRAVTVDDRDRESEQWPELVLSSVRDFLNSVWDQADHDFTKVGSLGRTVSFKDLSIDQNAKVTISKIVTGRLSNGQRNGESLSFGSNLVDGAEGGERTKDYGSGRPKGILRRPRTRSKKTIAKAATSITRRVVRTLWWIFGIGWRRPSRSAPPYLSSSLEANSSADGSRADVEDALPSLARLPTQSQARPPSKPVTTNTREVINGSHLVRSFLIKILELSDEVIALFYPFETLKGHEHDGSRNRHGKGGAGKRAKSRRSYDSARVFSSVSYLAPTWIKENVFDPLEAIWMDSDQDEANTVSCGHAPFDGRGMNRSSLECERQGVDAERFFNIQGGDESDDAQGEDDSALYEVLRLALTDPQPRRSYHVGLGPRLQGIFDGIQNLLTGMIEIC